MQSALDKALQARLIAMMERDKRVRAELVASKELFTGYNSRMAAVHQENADELERIIHQYGWPGAALVGDEGSEAAWVVIQHAISRPALLRKCLPILKAAVKTGEVSAAQVAHLEDRISVFEGRPQRYGTQFDWDGTGRLSPCAIEDAERVDDYRKSVGLAPLAEGIEQVRKRAEAEGDKQPHDFEKRQREAAAWATSVGWR